eukprot:scaffold215089_cov21-Tisochrysis_lutea.AAC.2
MSDVLGGRSVCFEVWLPASLGKEPVTHAPAMIDDSTCAILGHKEETVCRSLPPSIKRRERRAASTG